MHLDGSAPGVNSSKVGYQGMRYFLGLLLLGIPLLIPVSLQADWLNLTGAETSRNIAEIYIGEDHVRVQLEIYPEDLEVFRELIPDEWIKDPNVQRPSLEERQALFSRQSLIIRDEQGTVLPAQFQRVEPRTRIDRQSPFTGMINPYTRQRIPGAPEDKRVVFAEIRYPFSRQPKQLTFEPPRDENGSPRVTLGFIAYHLSVPIVDFRYLGRAETLTLDWADPWYTQFENRNLTRHHKYPLMLYLYVEPRRVRLESLMRVEDIAEMTEFGDIAWSDNAAMHSELMAHIVSYQSEQGGLLIDGAQTPPDDIVVNYFTVGLSGLLPVENPASVDDASLLVGVSRHYFVDALPQSVSTDWTYFNPRIDQIPLVETDPAGPLPGFVYQDDPELSWNNQLKTWMEPVLTPVQALSGWRVNLPLLGKMTLFNDIPDSDRAGQIIADVFENVRVTYIEKNPAAFAAALERVTTTGALAMELSKLFAPEMRRGGAGEVRRFGEFTIDSMDALEESDGFRASVSGSALVQAMHWGHTDQLQLEFQMLADIVDEEGQWLLADLTLVDLKAL